MPAAQTIKQAKASFAARGRPSLNAQEQRQIERGLELEQRAERAKEAERRRAAAAKKRAEDESKSKHDKEKGKALLGTQRRKDRFGYVSSQFHLGAFSMGGKKKVEVERQMPFQGEEEEENLFGDDELDDEIMLNALDAPVEHAASDSAVFVPVVVPPAMKRSQSAPIMDDLMDDFWNDMESSTQIARELSENKLEAEVDMEATGKSASTRSASFGSVDFDLTAEDLDHLDPPDTSTKKAVVPPKALMATPQVPAKTTMMLPPTAPTRQPLRTIREPFHSKISNATMRLPQPGLSSVKMQPPPPRPASVMPAPARPLPRMPPPAKPATRPPIPNPQATSSKLANAPTSAIPPPPRRLHDQTPQQTKSSTVIRGPFLTASSLYCSPELGITLTQLESFVDDDIQLTQAMPG